LQNNSTKTFFKQLDFIKATLLPKIVAVVSHEHGAIVPVVVVSEAVGGDQLTAVRIHGTHALSQSEDKAAN